jgi:hypothetical protein
MQRFAWKQAVMGTLNVLVTVLAVRLTLLVAVCGAFWLAWAASSGPMPAAAIVPAVYSVLVVVPLVWLASSGR